MTNPTLIIVLSTDHLHRIKDIKCGGIYHRKQVRGDISGFYTVNQKRNTVGVFLLTKSSWDHDDEKGVSPGMHMHVSYFSGFFPFFFSPLHIWHYGAIPLFILYKNFSKALVMIISEV